MKKVTYIDVLKESLQEADTTKTSDILGPMVEPILGYDGNGEIKTHRNVSDILKKYYFESDNSDDLVDVSNMDSVTDGEENQSKIDKVKKNVGEIIDSKTMTDQPTEKTLKEMVVGLEEILLTDEENILDESDDNGLDFGDNILFEDEVIEDKLESLLESEFDEYGDDGVEIASDDVILDKDSKIKLESALAEADGDSNPEEETEKEDEAVETKSDSDGVEEENPLDVDEQISESLESVLEGETVDEMAELLEEDAFSDNEKIIDNIESILDEQGDIIGIESPLTSSGDNDIDIENPMHQKVTTENMEDSVLEWLIMEIENKSDSLDEFDDNVLEESFDDDIDIDDDFNISKIDSDKIRV